MLEKDIEKVLLTKEQLEQRVKELGAQITKDYQGKDLVLAAVLRGSYVFMADLTRAIDLPLTVDFMAVSSYGAGTVSSGQVEIKKDLSDSIAGKDLLIVEDILDSGNTLYYLKDVLAARHPASIHICTLMDKPERRVKPIKADYAGFQIPDAFRRTRPVGEINPLTGEEYLTNTVRKHPTIEEYVQVYDRTTHEWSDVREDYFWEFQEKKKQMMGKEYRSPIRI